MYKALSLALVLAAASGAASAMTIDFETGFSGDETVVGDGNAWTFQGVTFTRGEEQTVVATGGATDGFVPNDQVAGGFFGNFFLTDDFSANTSVSLTLDFASSFVRDLSFFIADIDGGGKNQETFVVTATLVGGGTEVITRSSGDGFAGDGIATEFDFSGFDVESVSIIGSTPNGTRNIGWGIDNISLAPIPLPAGALLLMGGLGGLALLRRRQQRG